MRPSPRSMFRQRRRPHYRDAVEDLARRHAPALEPGKVYVAEVRHDDWCDQLAGFGPCNCDPEVTLVEASA